MTAAYTIWLSAYLIRNTISSLRKGSLPGSLDKITRQDSAPKFYYGVALHLFVAVGLLVLAVWTILVAAPQHG